MEDEHSATVGRARRSGAAAEHGSADFIGGGGIFFREANVAQISIATGGAVSINGSLNVTSAKNFKIDHPLDLANKYLVHAAIESSDVMNLYNGNFVLDKDGKAWVKLPDWFETLSREFRDQLTAIGTPGPKIYISKEVQGNRFQIAGGKPGMKVPWQVTGIRQDPYEEAHRMKME